MTKKSLSMVLVLMLMVSCLGAMASTDVLNPAGVMPIVQEPVTLKIAAALRSDHKSYDQMYLFNKYEEMTGVHIDWDITPQESRNERINLLIAGDDLPDVFMRCNIENNAQANYGTQGVLIDLKPMLEEYAPNFYALMQKYPDIERSITIDGCIYGLPQIIENLGARTRSFWISEKWLEKTNLSMPTTIDEFYDMLIAFRDCDFNGNGIADETPISLNGSRLGTLFDSFSGIFGMLTLGSKSGDVDLDADGNLRFYPTSDRYHEMLVFLNKLWSEGLIDKDCLTQSTGELSIKVDDGLIGISAMLNLPNYMGSNPGDFAPMPAIENQWGERMWNNCNNIVNNYGTFCITNKCKNPEVALRWADFFYSHEGVEFIYYGIEGETFVYDENGNRQFTKEFDPNDPINPVKFGVWTPKAGSEMPLIQYEDLVYDVTNVTTARMLEAGELHADSVPEVMWNPVFNATEQIELTTLSTDIDTYIKECRIKFMIGEMDIETQWEEYVTRLEALGADRYLELYTESYNRTFK